jgi:hypothetical protein
MYHVLHLPSYAYCDHACDRVDPSLQWLSLPRDGRLIRHRQKACCISSRCLKWGFRSCPRGTRLAPARPVSAKELETSPKMNFLILEGFNCQTQLYWSSPGYSNQFSFGRFIIFSCHSLWRSSSPLFPTRLTVPKSKYFNSGAAAHQFM